MLGWSHYVVLLTTPSEQERRFYEIEAHENSRGVRELKRQINTSLFERLALSRNKDEVKALAQVGQLVAQPADIIKSPYVLEFLDLPERPTYSEHQLEIAIIDKLESFLLELGKGFYLKHARSASHLTTITFTSIWSSTTASYAAMSSLI